MSDPSRISGTQLSFGQTWGALNGLADRVGTRNCPFLLDVTVAVLLTVKSAVCDSIGLFLFFALGLLQSMIAE